ncbi:GIY-YIG nuclease family protein [Nissabacter sp. SGAir0207]|uniref:GIY-YIG nuclease family protein n=1 Tax=Nissabacter sp. SGAir0207 TaxID=2126321 RepID=UPI0010CCEEB9|nr:GIY-YIG nuclease family protein [Nissabacter sp. SGAir0207]QCR36972.1 hypothetical protein C1N62_13175 [Nissabacter sp. SGAir0207]
MVITMELLKLGATSRGSHKRRQIELIGEEWPPARGWKEKVIGREISDEVAEEFIRLGSSNINADNFQGKERNEYWFNSRNPVSIYIYTLALSNDCYYVGLTANIKKRMEEHFTGKGAEWTKLNTPLQLISAIDIGTKNAREAEKIENETTVELMIQYGIDKVRGGCYTNIEQKLVEKHLIAHGAWERIMQSKFARHPNVYEGSWENALERFLDDALCYYDAGSPENMHEIVFKSLFSLTQYSYWNEAFAPCLSWEFWNKKGILPVLLSFKYARTVGSRLPSAYDVLAAALNRGESNQYPLRRLFLLGWQSFQPQTTDKQAKTIIRFMTYLNENAKFERKYDAFVSVLFPEMRTILQI